jgi:hypothetical protein
MGRIGRLRDRQFGRLTVAMTTSREMYKSSGKGLPRGSASASSALGVRTGKLPSFADAICAFDPH